MVAAAPGDIVTAVPEGRDPDERSGRGRSIEVQRDALDTGGRPAGAGRITIDRPSRDLEHPDLGVADVVDRQIPGAFLAVVRDLHHGLLGAGWDDPRDGVVAIGRRATGWLEPAHLSAHF